MKYLILILLGLSVGQISVAQGLSDITFRAGKNPQMSKHHQALSGLLQHQNNKAEASKTTTGITYSRVIAQSTKDSVGTYFDSVHLAYGTNRGSNYDYNDLIYPYNYPYNASPLFNYAGNFTKPQVLFDTMKHWTLDPNTYVYGPYEEDLGYYDTHENTTAFRQYFADSAISPNMNYVNRFSSSNNIDSAYYFSYVAGVSDSAFKQFFVYNTAHLLTEDSTYEYHSGAWHLAGKTLYTYDGSNNLIQIDNYSNTTDTTFTMPLIEQIQYINTYDGSHRLISVASGYYNGTTFGPYVRDTFAYSGTDTWHNSWKEYQWDPINMVWAPMFNMSKSVNLSGFPDTVTIQGFDSILNAWVPQTMDVISYNTTNYPDTLKEYDYAFTYFPAVASYTTIYYYQAWVNTLETNNLPSANSEGVLYPNPASGQFTISGLNLPAGTGICVSVVNASGQAVSRETMPWQGEINSTAKDWLPGIYWVAVQDYSGKLIYRQAIVRQ